MEVKMRNTMSKTIITGLAALALGASAFASVEPASAAAWHGGGRGWHGGGWHGGGWRGGGWWGPAVVGGLAAGALLAAPYAYGYGPYGYGYGYGRCTGYQPMYDAYGNYIGQQLVRTC
jgi:hypothetical protein